MQSCTNLFFHPYDVSNYLKRLKPSLTETYDGIPQIVYRKCATSLAKPLTHIFNISMLLGEVPTTWKHAIVTAIPKNGRAKSAPEFRPISLTPTPVKVMERIIRDKISLWLERFHVIPSEQHGFCSGASTTTNVTDSVHDWNSALNKGCTIDIIYVDLSKAFDKVCHNVLISKLEHIGIRGKLLEWIRSYLNNRQMTVRVGNDFSRSYPCSSGVPQGGALSPLLFLVYTLDLPHVLKTSPHVKVQLYADDIKIYGMYTRENFLEVHSALSSSLEKMANWASTWNLPINFEKTFVLHLGDLTPTPYSVNNTILKFCQSAKDLGVLVDKQLKFSDHIDNVVSEAYSVLFTIFRNVHCCNAKILQRLYQAYVVPHLEYCSQAWSPTSSKEVVKIEKVQRTFTRLLLYRINSGSVPYALPNYGDRLRILGLRTLKFRRVIADLVFCFRILRKELKLNASRYWVFRPASARNGRFNLSYPRIEKRNYTHMFNSLFCRTARWFQLLPPEVLQSENSKLFKSRLKRLELLRLLNIDDCC
ncbi:hypothetical protein Y032_0034g2863 [Ancylostoma ceylanicum]|nr:hypothetical protein Y032_0034g2863 [Ancylostoma ceylanicum]